MSSNQKDLQGKYMEFQMVQQQLEQVSKYLEELDLKLQEFSITKNNLQNMDQTPQNADTLVSLAPGIFARAELKDSQRFIINVGANILVEKTIPQITEMLDKQIKEISQVQIQMDQNLVSLNQKANELIQDLQS